MSNTEFSRRHLFAGAAAVALAANLPSLAHAASRIPTTTQQGAGFYRFKIGTFDAAVISDGALDIGAPGPLGVNAKPADVQRALAAAGQPTDKAGLHFNSLLVDTGRELVLIDPGSGPHFGPTLGKLLQNLRNAGVAPEAIDRIISTHAHPDHIWGTVDADFRAAFPKAQLHVPAAEVAFWTAPNVNMGDSKFPPEMKQMIIANTQKVLANWKDRIVTFRAGDEVIPGVRSIATPGHTVGHVSLRLDGGGSNQLVYTADIVHHHVTGLVHPDWTPLYDQDAEQAKTTRKKLLTSLTAEKARLLVYHFPFRELAT